MRILLQPGEVLEVGLVDSEDDLLTISYFQTERDSTFAVSASLPDNNGRVGFIYHQHDTFEDDVKAASSDGIEFNIP